MESQMKTKNFARGLTLTLALAVTTHVVANLPVGGDGSMPNTSNKKKSSNFIDKVVPTNMSMNDVMDHPATKTLGTMALGAGLSRLPVGDACSCTQTLLCSGVLSFLMGSKLQQWSLDLINDYGGQQLKEYANRWLLWTGQDGAFKRKKAE